VLIINGVKTDPKKEITTKKANIAKENTIVSSLLKIFFRNEFNCSNI
jgi:hypothetical protein